MKIIKEINIMSHIYKKSLIFNIILFVIKQ